MLDSRQPHSPQPQLASSLVMVRPLDFGFNEQTGVDNEFQHRPSSMQSEEIVIKARQEFEAMVSRLDAFGVEVIVLGKTHTTERLPDAVFPNNWFSTRSDGQLFIYPMKTPNRQAEVQSAPLTDALKQHDYQIERIVDFRSEATGGAALEGTGCLVFHHPSRQVFAALSERCDKNLLQQYSSQLGYQAREMCTVGNQGNPIYHTNVLMACGENFAVLTKAVLANDRETADSVDALQHTVDDLIVISRAQMAENFCGNILQVRNRQGDTGIVMSAAAYQGFAPDQRAKLERHGELIICEIPTIEYIGGGSARCMVAENFLPKNKLAARKSP